jgi:transcriptional repressor NrdR
MHCPYCGATESRVIDTTQDSEHDEIRRRRHCQACGKRFSTIERVRAELPLVVKEEVTASAPRREPFDCAKLRRSILTACAKRPISEAAIDRLIGGIEARLRAEPAGEVSSRTIGELVIEGLRDLDEIAYIRYAIVFLELDDLDAVQSEIGRILELGHNNHNGHSNHQLRARR